MDIRVDNLQGPEIQELLRQHLEDMHRHSPPESVHALDVNKLKSPEITLWSAWREGELLGCGALKQLNHLEGEVKSMRTRRDHLRKGVAGFVLKHILAESKHRGYKRLYLETGPVPAFDAARELYRAHGFEYCPPFGDYTEDPYSVFMVKTL